MNILTIYTPDISKLFGLIDYLILRIDMTFLAADPERLFNNEIFDDVPMPALTLKTKKTREELMQIINDETVFVCEEDPSDW